MIHTASQSPSFVRIEIARLLGWAENKVRVKVPYLGGGFGAKLYIKTEALTAAAFCLFADTPADLAIIEVGAGGATDATNVMNRPAACVVTPISRDHESMFGVSGVAAIARLKAGIFREGTPAIVAEQPRLALAVLREEARTAAAPMLYAGEDWNAAWDGDAFVYASDKVKVRAPWLGLPGRHQSHNAGAACAAVEALGNRRITPDAMAAGLREAVW